MKYEMLFDKLIVTIIIIGVLASAVAGTAFGWWMINYGFETENIMHILSGMVAVFGGVFGCGFFIMYLFEGRTP